MERTSQRERKTVRMDNDRKYDVFTEHPSEKAKEIFKRKPYEVKR